MLVVSALQNTAYTGNYCLVLMNEKKESMTVEVMLFCFRPTMKWSAYTGNYCLVLMNEKKEKYGCRGHAFLF